MSIIQRPQNALAVNAAGALGTVGRALYESPEVRRGIRRAAQSARQYISQMYKRRRTTRSGVRRNVFRKRSSYVPRHATSGRGITEQYDKRSIYKKRYMPKRKKRLWKRFSKKVHAVSEKDMGTQTFVRNQTVSFSTITPDRQVIAWCSLYGLKSDDKYMNDMRRIIEAMHTGDPTSASGTTKDKTTHIIFKSGVLDITVRNTSNDGAPTPALNQWELEVDVYELTSKSEWEDSEDAGATAIKNNILEVFKDGTNDTKGINGAASTCDIVQRGVTPWDVTQALSKYKMKILKKTKYFLKNDQVFTYQMRDPKRHVVNRGNIVKHVGANYIGITKHVMFVAKPTPGNIISATDVPELSIGMTRKYMYKVEGVNESRSFQEVDAAVNQAPN